MVDEAAQGGTGRDLSRALTIREFVEATGTPHGTAVRWFRNGRCGFKDGRRWYIDIDEAATIARLEDKPFHLNRGEVHVLPGGFTKPADADPSSDEARVGATSLQLAVAMTEIEDLENRLAERDGRIHELDGELAEARRTVRRLRLRLAAWEDPDEA